MARDITALHPFLQQKLEQLKALCDHNDLNLGTGECFRTMAEQDALYAQGRTVPGAIITNAPGSSYSSQHQWGIAFDFFKNEKGHEYDDLEFFSQVGALAESIGLGWGGNWTSFKDRPHLYLPDWGSTATRLKASYGTPENFMKTWPTTDVGASTDSSTAHTADTTNTSSDSNVSGSPAPNAVIAKGQQQAAYFTGIPLSTDGIIGSQTRKARVRVLQHAMNLDYGTTIAEDGIWGAKSKAKLGSHYVKRGEKQYMVTALELLLLLKGYEPNGIEYPGIFGSGLEAATRQYQKASGLHVDGVAGPATFQSLIS